MRHTRIQEHLSQPGGAQNKVLSSTWLPETHPPLLPTHSCLHLALRGPVHGRQEGQQHVRCLVDLTLNFDSGNLLIV